MSFKKMTAVALTAFLFATPTLAEENSSATFQHRDSDSRYAFTVEPGQVMIFRQPVSFTGEVVETSQSHRTILAANDMTIRVPNEALVWNGDTQTFAQSTEIGDQVVVHLRQEEPYRIMRHLTSSEQEMVAIGSYDGVFFVSTDFIRDLALDQLDRDIYANPSAEATERRYDVDLASVKDDTDIDE